MGNFYTTVQILDNEKLGSKKFTEKFCKKMADEGYVSCGGDEAEQSYILHFAENSSWVAIASEEYTPDGQKSRQDAPRFAKMLKAPCVTTNVIDSDCAVMDVYGATGKKLDTLIMGRADDYFGDDYPEPSEKPWGMFLADGTTWERFMEVRNGDYTFVEDGLAELAPLIGMDSSNIGFTSEEAIADDDTVFLYFKSAGKKPKKLTLNAAFKQVFGQALEPLGFQLTKGKYPYFVRVINDEILHIITLRTEQACYPEDKAFSILGGIATVYRRNIDLSVSPMNNSCYNFNWLHKDIGHFYYDKIKYEPEPKPEFNISTFYYFSEVPKSLPCVMEEALENTKKYMIYVMNRIDTLDKCIDFLMDNALITTAPIDYGLDFSGGSDYDDGLIFLKTNHMHHKELWQNIVEGREEISEEGYNRVKEKYKFFTDPVYIEKLSQEYERRKKHNLEALKNCGVFTETTEPPKPKKLTLNAAFKQVFGQALEPLGFKLVKSKYPYFVRVINDEIAHVITMRDDSASGEYSFDILGGIITVYSNEINFVKNPKLYAGHWLDYIGSYYQCSFPNDYSRKEEINMDTFYLKDLYNHEKVKEVFIIALERVKKWILPELDRVVDVDSAISFFYRFNPKQMKIIDEISRYKACYFCNESLLFTKAKNINDLIDGYKEVLKRGQEFDKRIWNTEPQFDPEIFISEIKQNVKQLIKNKKSIENAEMNAKKNSLILKNL